MNSLRFSHYSILIYSAYVILISFFRDSVKIKVRQKNTYNSLFYTPIKQCFEINAK
jgi:hypothetical protein